jgi:type IV secretory pathway VirB10-like protein
VLAVASQKSLSPIIIILKGKAMIQKQYPKTIRMRRRLIWVGALAGIFVAGLIIYNVYSDSRAKNNLNNANAPINQDQKPWYESEVISQRVARATPQLANSPLMHANDRTPLYTRTQHKKVSYDKKDMSAAITSNQLTDTQNSLGNIGNLSSSTLSNQNANANSSDDPNQQAEKMSFMQSNHTATDNDYLDSVVKKPLSPYELQAGTIIPGILVTGINSDLPGQITGQVRSTVYDSISGRYVLIPQGAKIVGLYDSQVTYGQARVLVAWQRIIFPNGESIDLQGMSGADMSGYAGFKDQVNNHYAKIFGSVILMSVLSAGAQLSQPQNNNNTFAAPSVGQTMAQSLGNNLSNTATMITSKNINIQPTLQIRPGYEFNISVTKDMVFPGAYQD